MTVIYNLRERRIIPNWRDFKRTLQLGELRAYNSSIIPIQINIDRSLTDWTIEKSFGTAVDLVNSAFVAGISDKDEIREAISLIRANEERTSKTLLEISRLIEHLGNSYTPLTNQQILEIDVNTVDEFQAFIHNKALFRIINKTKHRARNELYNPIVWVDLARLYSLHGLYLHAERSISTALHLAPNNRFVLRSATRFFIHTNQPDKALDYLKKSQSLKYDPWLISAHIATSCILERFSPLIKNGINIIESSNYSPFDITELASAIGTFEFRNGSFKKAKKLLGISLQCPNDNSLAQMEWLSKKDPRLSINPSLYHSVINPFEAFAYESYEKGNWRDALYNSIKWFLDMPFSKRPVLLGSFIAGSLLKDKNSSILLCEVGLQANPNDPMLLNNLIYDCYTSDQSARCEIYLKKFFTVDFNRLSNEQKITMQATLGLVSLRKNDIEIGKKLYELAIKNAESIDNDYLKNLAIVNYTRELIIKNLPEKEKYINIVLAMKLENQKKDLILLINEILELIKMDN